MSEHRANDQGFTLMEVLVAFAVLAVMLTALYQLYGGSLARYRGEEDRIAALRLARSTLAELGITRPVSLGMDESLVSVDQQWRIRIVVEARPQRSSDSGVQGTWVTVAVSRDDKNTTAVPPVALSTYVLLARP